MKIKSLDSTVIKKEKKSACALQPEKSNIFFIKK